MRREIKFRAWDKNKGEMFDVRGLAISDLNDDFDLIDTSLIGNGTVWNWNLLEDYELMQYTGLKDKSGMAEIYEGDITKDPKGFLAKVFWDEKASAFALDLLDGDLEWLHEHNKYIQVIGNIYENPELTEVDK